MMRLTVSVVCAFLLQCTLGMEDLPELSNKQLTHSITETVVSMVEGGQPDTPGQRSSVRPTFDPNVHLKWVRWSGTLPSGAVKIFNQETKRTDYICVPSSGCYWSPGYYSPSKGSYCYNPCGVEERHAQFDLLVNQHNYEVLQWRAFNGHIPANPVTSFSSPHIYVGRNRYGLGSVSKGTFYLPWGGKQYKYRSDYDVLTLSKDRFTQRIFNVEYHVDHIASLSQPPTVLVQNRVTNNNCQAVTQTVNMEKSTERQSSWESSVSSSNTLSVSSTLTVGIPIISVSASVGLEVTTEKTYTEGTAVTETISHSLSVELPVPPNHYCVVKMAGKKYSFDLPFTAHVAKTYPNGRVHTTTVTGIYKGVQVGEIEAVVERCEPIPNARPCDPPASL